MRNNFCKNKWAQQFIKVSYFFNFIAFMWATLYLVRKKNRKFQPNIISSNV